MVELPDKTFSTTHRDPTPPGIYGKRGEEHGDAREETALVLRCQLLLAAAVASRARWLVLSRASSPANVSPMLMPEMQSFLASQSSKLHRLATLHSKFEIFSDVAIAEENDVADPSGRAKAGALLGAWPGGARRVANLLLLPRQKNMFHPIGKWNVLVASLSSSPSPPSSALPDRRVEQSTLPQSLQHRPRVRMVQPLRGTPQEQERLKAEREALGGLRNPAESTLRNDRALAWGPRLRDVVEEYYGLHPEFPKALLAAIDAKEEPLLDEAWVPGLTATLQASITAGLTEDHLLCRERGTPTDCRLEADLIKSWAELYQDPGRAAADCLWDGFAAGILHQPDIGPVFPPYAEEDPDAAETLFTDFERFVNYSGVDNDDFVKDTMDSFADRDPPMMFKSRSLQKTRDFLDGELPHLSRYAIVTRVKGGKVKNRVILDIKQSGVRAVTRRGFRVLLPRTIDAVNGDLELLGLCLHANSVEIGVEMLVLDFIDAFWQLPLRHDERRFFAGRVRGWYYVYRRTAQGSRLGPFSWGVTQALCNRLIQPLFLRKKRRKRPASATRAKESLFSLLLRTYVDDPIAAAAGTKAERDLDFAVLVGVWLALGFELAFPKAQRGVQVDWIGFRLVVWPHQVEVWIDAEKAEEICTEANAMQKENVIGLARLRTFAGKCSNTASLIPTWRPFLNELWAAISSANTDKAGSAPSNTVWLSQIQHSLKWIAAFLEPKRNPDACWDNTAGRVGLCRVWPLDAYLNIGTAATLTWDASPFGLGAYYEEDGVILEYFAAPLTEDDEEVFGYKRGSADGQQTWEALTPLCALRAWKHRWRRRRLRLCSRGDNMASLAMMLSLRAKGAGPSAIAREMALELGDGSYAPDLIEHLPGVMNPEADELSRRLDPAHQPWALPVLFHGVRETVLPRRPLSWYLTMGTPPAVAASQEAGSGQPLPRDNEECVENSLAPTVRFQ